MGEEQREPREALSSRPQNDGNGNWKGNRNGTVTEELENVAMEPAIDSNFYKRNGVLEAAERETNNLGALAAFDSQENANGTEEIKQHNMEPASHCDGTGRGTAGAAAHGTVGGPGVGGEKRQELQYGANVEMIEKNGIFQNGTFNRGIAGSWNDICLLESYLKDAELQRMGTLAKMRGGLRDNGARMLSESSDFQVNGRVEGERGGEGKREGEKVELRVALDRERSRVQTLREQLSQLEEVTAMQNVHEAGTQAELARLREANSQLALRVETLQDTVEKMENERRQLNSRLSALQRAVQQLEREASIRARVQYDMAAATAQSSKGWLGWGSKDPLAEAAAIAEEARVQKAAAAAMVERLVDENAELMEQLNEQSALIERLAQTYGNLAHRPNWDFSAEASLAAKEDPQSPERLGASDVEGFLSERRLSRKNGSQNFSGRDLTDSGRIDEGEYGVEVQASKGGVGERGVGERGVGVRGAFLSHDGGDMSPSFSLAGSPRDSREERGSNHGTVLGNGGEHVAIPMYVPGAIGSAPTSSSSPHKGTHNSSNPTTPKAPKYPKVHSPFKSPESPIHSPREVYGTVNNSLTRGFSPRKVPPGVRIGVVMSPRAMAGGPSRGGGGGNRNLGGASYGGRGERGVELSKKEKKLSIIGAPFRFVSYLAEYVSGADLIEKNLA